MFEQDKKPESLFYRIIGKYFASQLEFRVRLFHVLAMGGILISFLMVIISVINYTGILPIIANSVSTLLSFSLLVYSYRSGKYQLCYMITIIIIFFGFFTMLFFSSAGYHGGMPAFFIFAIVFTVFMLEGRKALFFTACEIIYYTVLCVIAYYHPELVTVFETEAEIVIDISVSAITVSMVLGLCLYLHFRLYNIQQKKLDEQNDILAQGNRMKTEFLANASHEMRTPLTVTSVNVQTVMEILEDLENTTIDEDALKLLGNAQNEIMRLSRMVGGMLTLASMSETTDRQKLDFTALLNNGIEMMRLNIGKRGNIIETDIESGLYIFGNADLITQVFTNVLQNAGTHTERGVLSVKAKKTGHEINIEIHDTGKGIAPEMLEHVFERGISTGGTGYGLYLCKTVIESHSGKIWIESELDKGTSVYYVLPVYEGQYGGDK